MYLFVFSFRDSLTPRNDVTRTTNRYWVLEGSFDRIWVQELSGSATERWTVVRSVDELDALLDSLHKQVRAPLFMLVTLQLVGHEWLGHPFCTPLAHELSAWI